MELLAENTQLSLWLTHYGSFVLFFLLALGIIALPVPEETLLVVSGILMHCEKLHPISTFLSAYAGSMTGITMSYIIGKTLGYFLIMKYGKWVGITELRLMKAHYWFEKFGTWALSIGYFIPGVRHFTGLSAGIARLEFKRFALFAYSGAMIWVSVFLSIGYFFGRYWLKIYEKLEIGLREIFIALLIALLIAFVIHFFKKNHNI